MKMRVARLVAPGRIELGEEEIPSPGPGELLVRIGAVGICGSDVHYFVGGGLGSSKVPMPLVLGHEPAGTIQAAEGSSLGFTEGDRIAIDPSRSCGVCQSCLEGRRNLCSRGSFMGSQSIPGALREYAVIGEAQAVRLPAAVELEGGALLEPFAVALHSVNRSALRPGETVAIYGAGPIGICILIAARLAGAALSMIIDRLSNRVEIAKRLFGADVGLVDQAGNDTTQIVKDMTGGRGVDVAFDAAGMERTIFHCLQVAAPGGRVALVGIPTYDLVRYNPHIARVKELTILNVRRSNQSLETALSLLDGRDLNLRSMITHRFPLEEVQSAFEVIAQYRDGVIKAMIKT